jgi:hypothetical protein
LLAEQATETDAATNAEKANKRFKPTSTVDCEPASPPLANMPTALKNRGTQSEKTVLRREPSEAVFVLFNTR